MKNKTFILASLSILSLILLTAFAVATPVFTSVPANATITEGDNWAGVDFNATDAVNYSVNNNKFTINDTGFLNDIPTLPVGVYNLIISINNTINEMTKTAYRLEVTAPEAETCTVLDTRGNLDISIEDITVENGGYGKDTDWFPLDEISIEVNVENNGAEKIKNIEIKWGLYDKDSGKWIIDDKESDFNLKDGDDQTVTISFKLNKPSKFEDNGDYVFYVWATGEDEEFDDEETCVADSENIEMQIESDFVILNDLTITPETAFCGSEITISGDVWNIGEDDQDEVMVLVYNQELGLSQEVEIGDINSFDSESLDFSFALPKDAKEKSYTIKLTVYDEDKNVYENDYDDEKSIKDIFLKVEGSCAAAEASVIAVLESGGQAGKPLVVKATITNTGDESSGYSLNAAGYSEWATSASLDKSSLTLDAGESAEVLITFQTNKEAIGDKVFNLEILSENELIASQPVQVTLEKKGFGITGNFLSGEGNTAWILGIASIILIVLIIIVALRIARK